MRSLEQILRGAIALKASDILFSAGVPVAYRVHGKYGYIDSEKLTAEDSGAYVHEILGDELFERLKTEKEIDTSIRINGYNFRVGAFTHMGSYAASLRVLSNKIRSFEELELPQSLAELCNYSSGLILITGATGSGKSTTMAAMLDYINSTKNGHIITIEDPIEYVYESKRSIVTQKEVGRDTLSFKKSLRAVLREDPDVIAIGEMRDPETISAAITCAETGHLVISTLHTSSVSGTVARIIDAFDSSLQAQIRTQLSMTLRGVISQRLIPAAAGTGRVVAYEYAPFTPALRALIRSGKNHMIAGQIQLGSGEGMISLQRCIDRLVSEGKITHEAAEIYGK